MNELKALKALWIKYTRTSVQRGWACFIIASIIVAILCAIFAPVLFYLGMWFVIVVGPIVGICWLITWWVGNGESY